MKRYNSEKLKPCPFCGGKAHIMQMGYPHWIYCEDCGAKVHGGVIGEEEGEQASIEAWNKRTEGWIPCSVKLPEVGEPVLIYDSYNEEMVVASLDCDKTGFSNDDFYYGLKNVPLWMALPEPPKEDEE